MIISYEMARPRSEKTLAIRQSLLDLLHDGYHLPGQRFLSARALALRYGVSYQTADRIIRELCAEGRLERHAGSGTYIAGQPKHLARAVLIFNERSKREGSFGDRLFRELSARIDALGVSWKRGEPERVLETRDLPVLWECPRVLARLISDQRPAILLNDRPPAGLAATWIDSVVTDDFSGGVVAAELIRQRGCPVAKPAIFSGPARDSRSQLRVAGFLSVFPKAGVVCAGTWDGALAEKKVSELARFKPDAIFCCNDRLAQAVHEKFRHLKLQPPFLIGFDDAPVADRLRLTTVALPWRQLVDGAASLIQKRLAGDCSHAVQLLYAPRPVVRG